MKVDMEAKLRAWLASKGKTKSSQRIEAVPSPSWRKTPTAKRSTVREKLLKGRNTTNQGAKERTLNVALRNLLNEEGPLDFCLESPLRVINDSKEDSKYDTYMNVEESNKCMAGMPIM